jgi:hypothetical protein
VKLIREEVLDTRTITEEKDGKKFFVIEGPFLQAGVKNRNGRHYRPELMEREVNRYLQEKVSRGSAWGELGHPAGPGINLDRVSHLTTSLVREGNDWVGKARLLDHGFGLHAEKMIGIGGTLGVSSRGLGSLKMNQQNGWQEVQDDFHLAVAADIVADPSAPNAFVNGIMEGVEYFYDEAKGTWAEKFLTQAHEQIVTSTIRQIDENKTRLYETFLSRLGERHIFEDSDKSSLHTLFKSHGYHHHGSEDTGEGTTIHSYIAEKPASNSLHTGMKRHAKFRYVEGAGAHGVLKDGKSPGATYHHPDGSMVKHIVMDGHGVILHHQKHVSETTIFETELSKYALAKRAGMTYENVDSAWKKAKSLNEIAGRDEDDFDHIAATAFRILGLR